MVATKVHINLADHNNNVIRMKPKETFEMDPVFSTVYTSSKNSFRLLVHRIRGEFRAILNGMFNYLK